MSARKIRLYGSLATAVLAGWLNLHWRTLVEWPDKMGAWNPFKHFVYASEQVGRLELLGFATIGIILGTVAIGATMRVRSRAVPAPLLVGVATVASYPVLLGMDVATYASEKLHQFIPVELLLHAAYGSIVAVAASIPHVLQIVVRRVRRAEHN